MGTEQALLLAIAGAGGGGVIPVTWNAADKGSNIVLSSGDMIATKPTGGGAWQQVRGNVGRQEGYFEVEITAHADSCVGISTSAASLSTYPGGAGDTNGLSYMYFNGNKYNQGSSVGYGATYGIHTIGVHIGSGGAVTFYKNGVSQGLAYNMGAGITWYPAVGIYAAASDTMRLRAKTADFLYTNPGLAWER